MSGSGKKSIMDLKFCGRIVVLDLYLFGFPFSVPWSLLVYFYLSIFTRVLTEAKVTLRFFSFFLFLSADGDSQLTLFLSLRFSLSMLLLYDHPHYHDVDNQKYHSYLILFFLIIVFRRS